MKESKSFISTTPHTGMGSLEDESTFSYKDDCINQISYFNNEAVQNKL